MIRRVKVKNIFKQPRKLKKLRLLLLLTVFAALLQGFMFFESGLRWQGYFPNIKYVVNPAVNGFGRDVVLSETASASSVWFVESESRFSYNQTGETTRGSVSSISLDCSESGRKSNLLSEKTVFAENEPDPDCTGSACSFLWSCGDEIVHFDVVLNTNGYDFLPGAGTENTPGLRNTMIHEFGHVAGLSHCRAGEKNCASGNPADGAMPIFAGFFNSQLTLSNDDRSGMKTLYGNFHNKFPKTGKYALSTGEIEAIADLVALQHEEKLDTPERRQEQAMAVKETFDFVDSGAINRTLGWAPVRGYQPSQPGSSPSDPYGMYPIGMTALEFQRNQIDLLKAGLYRFSDLQIKYMKQTLAAGSVINDDMIKKLESNERTLPIEDFTKVDAMNLELRRAIIDEEISRK